MKFRPNQCPSCKNRRNIAGLPITKNNDPANESNKKYFICVGKPYRYKASKEWCVASLITKSNVAKNACHYYEEEKQNLRNHPIKSFVNLALVIYSLGVLLPSLVTCVVIYGLIMGTLGSVGILGTNPTVLTILDPNNPTIWISCGIPASVFCILLFCIFRNIFLKFKSYRKQRAVPYLLEGAATLSFMFLLNNPLVGFYMFTTFTTINNFIRARVFLLENNIGWREYICKKLRDYFGLEKFSKWRKRRKPKTSKKL